MNKNYIAYYAVLAEIEYFETREQAIDWLEVQHNEDMVEGYSDESCDGEDYIAKITHRSKFVVTDLFKNYKWNEKKQEYINADGDRWLHSIEFDEIGKVVMEKVKPERKK